MFFDKLNEIFKVDGFDLKTVTAGADGKVLYSAEASDRNKLPVIDDFENYEDCNIHFVFHKILLKMYFLQ